VSIGDGEYLAIRERMQDQLMLPGIEEEERGLQPGLTATREVASLP
jgi:hypothetical protein